MSGFTRVLGIICLLAASFGRPAPLFAYSANKVFMETLEGGRYRVAIVYTVPALKEFRQAQAVFTNKKEADAFYWHLIRGGEFAVGSKIHMWFIPPKSAPEPW